MTTKTEVSAAEIAKKLGVNPRKARMALRAAGIRAPYKPSDVAKITAVIKGDKPKPVKSSKPKAAPTPVSA